MSLSRLAANSAANQRNGLRLPEIERGAGQGLHLRHASLTTLNLPSKQVALLLCYESTCHSWKSLISNTPDIGFMMGGLTSFLAIYFLGGITFIPLLLVVVLIHAYFTFPIHDETTRSGEQDSLIRHGDTADSIQDGSKGLDERFSHRNNQDSDVAAGYFAVCREYVPGGVNGKPPERTTPAGSTVVSSPSPSVYQSMYRSIFDRKNTASPLDNKGVGKPQRKGGNVFYVVLR
jgi:hypothetical protein